MIFMRLVIGLDVFETLKILESKLLRLGKIPVKNFFLAVFVDLRGELMALGIASIHLSNLGQKVENAFGLAGNGFLDGFFLGIFLATILIGLGTDGWL